MTEHFRELQHAETLLELGRPAEAEERVRSVLAGDPDHVVALFTLALARRGLCQHDRGVRRAREVAAQAAL